MGTWGSFQLFHPYISGVIFHPLKATPISVSAFSGGGGFLECAVQASEMTPEQFFREVACKAQPIIIED